MVTGQQGQGRFTSTSYYAFYVNVYFVIINTLFNTIFIILGVPEYESQNLESKLRAELVDTRRAAVAESTQRNLHTQWRSYTRFCTELGTNQIPITIDKICLYAQYLSHRVKSPDTIRNYVSGICTYINLKGGSTPNLGVPVFKITMRGLRNIMKHKVKRARPMTPEILAEIYTLLDHTDPFHITIWNALVLGFFLLLRKSNLVPNKPQEFSPQKQLTGDKIKLCENAALVKITWTKTIQDGHRELNIPLLKIPNSPLCPVTALSNLAQLIGLQKGKPVLRYPTKKGWAILTYMQYNKALKTLIKYTGRNPSEYSTHSQRRGGASYAHEIGLSALEIQTLGDWRSEAYKAYIEDTLKVRTKAAFKIKVALKNNT